MIIGLRSVMENVPAHNFLTIPGAFNAKLRPDDAKFTFHNETNRNGELLVVFMEEFNLFPAKTKFMKSKKTSYGHLNTPMVQRPN